MAAQIMIQNVHLKGLFKEDNFSLNQLAIPYFLA